jgi:hypothetical protein
LVDLQNKVGDESSDVQSKLDDMKDVLDTIAANRLRRSPQAAAASVSAMAGASLLSHKKFPR